MASWPIGTSASASSYHAGQPVQTDECPQGCYYTYTPFDAINRNLTTFWNDDTLGVFPDSLFITFPSSSPTNLTGIQILSHADGYIIAYDIYLTVTSSSTPFMAASVTNVASVFSSVDKWNVPNSNIDSNGDILGITAIEIRVNDAQRLRGDLAYTRINEVYPIYAVVANTSPSASATPSSTISATPSSSPSVSSEKSKSSSNTGVIAGGVVGGVVVIIALVVLAAWLSRRRRRRTGHRTPEPTHYNSGPGMTIVNVNTKTELTSQLSNPVEADTFSQTYPPNTRTELPERAY